MRDTDRAPDDDSPAERALAAALAGELRAERARLNLTFDELSSLSGIPRRTLVRYLNGERTRSIPLPALRALAHALGLRTSAILERAERAVGDDPAR